VFRTFNMENSSEDWSDGCIRSNGGMVSLEKTSVIATVVRETWGRYSVFDCLIGVYL